MIKVLIVEDHHLFAEGVKSMFKPEDGIEIVEHTKNGNAIPSILDTVAIDVILMDIDMPILDGILCMELLKNKGYDVPILMLTMHQSMKQIKSALEKELSVIFLKMLQKPNSYRALLIPVNARIIFTVKSTSNCLIISETKI
ncbi:response regulator [Flavobacterium sp. F-65]|uniref:Response regulator n=1 Tax=Flavobacterium pisciphilum TaxID=2893755 RepID=A0ABS8MR71_9FLAO|nr:response regulator [Flavobacterium sp. F-65]MCC9071253.1 response regulator [Flavobacterium sp. F-65]